MSLLVGRLSQDQISYLKNVLGIENVVFDSMVLPSGPEASEVRISAIDGSPRLLIFGASEKPEFPFEGEARDLLEKMIQAMKLTMKEVVLIEWAPLTEELPSSVEALLSQFASLPRLAFGREAAKALRSGGSDVLTHSVATLMKQPEFKKETWAHLQKVMKGL